MQVHGFEARLVVRSGSCAVYALEPCVYLAELVGYLDVPTLQALLEAIGGDVDFEQSHGVVFVPDGDIPHDPEIRTLFRKGMKNPAKAVSVVTDSVGAKMIVAAIAVGLRMVTGTQLATHATVHEAVVFLRRALARVR